jgi:hypothetical protein
MGGPRRLRATVYSSFHADEEKGCLDPVFVAPLHSLGLRLVGLDGGAAGAELLCFAACVLELGARVGVDELARLDPLETVTL